MVFDINKGKYLLDSNSFIAPSRSYYKLEMMPTYWDWLANHQNDGLVIPKIIYDELINNDDELSQWVKKNLSAIVFQAYEQDSDFWSEYGKVINYIQNSGYYKNPGVNNWMQDTKADPKIIAIAKIYNLQIVTFEQSVGNLSKKNPIKKEPKIPDVAAHFGVNCIDLFKLEEFLKMVI